MFDPNSRYANLETARHTTPQGQVVLYKRRRFLPPADSLTPISQVTTTAGDRLDLLAARTLGDAEQFWHLCDANNAMNPLDLTAEPGTSLTIATPPILGGQP